MQTPELGDTKVGTLVVGCLIIREAAGKKVYLLSYDVE